MSEGTKFPELEEDVWGFVNMWKIEAWFKRCMEDFPVLFGNNQDAKTTIQWYEKWFSQFKDVES